MAYQPYYSPGDPGTCDRACGVVVGVVLGGLVLVVLVVAACTCVICRLYQHRQNRMAVQNYNRTVAELARVRIAMGKYLVYHPEIMDMEDAEIFSRVQADVEGLRDSDEAHVLSMVAQRRLRVAAIDRAELV